MPEKGDVAFPGRIYFIRTVADGGGAGRTMRNNGVGTALQGPVRLRLSSRLLSDVF